MDYQLTSLSQANTDRIRSWAEEALALFVSNLTSCAAAGLPLSEDGLYERREDALRLLFDYMEPAALLPLLLDPAGHLLVPDDRITYGLWSYDSEEMAVLPAGRYLTLCAASLTAPVELASTCGMCNNYPHKDTQ